LEQARGIVGTVLESQDNGELSMIIKVGKNGLLFNFNERLKITKM
jgi:hypothetical protein